MTSFWFDPAFLLDPVLIGISVIIIITSSVFLFIRKQKRSGRIVLMAVVLICIVYDLFILWVVVGFGSNRPIKDPEPIKTEQQM